MWSIVKAPVCRWPRRPFQVQFPSSPKRVAARPDRSVRTAVGRYSGGRHQRQRDKTPQRPLDWPGADRAMKTIELSEVSALAPHVQSGSHEPVILTQNGHAVAAILPVDERDVENLLLSINPQFQAILDRSERRLKSEGLVSSADVRTRLGLPAKDQ